jgi:signal transduction histidine kinase
LLRTLEDLLRIRATDPGMALDQAAELISEALGADKLDAWLRDRATDTLVVVGINDSPMARKERELGLDRLPISNGGRVVGVYESGVSFLTGHAEQDPVVLRGFREGLGIRSMLGVPLLVAGERRGVLLASSALPDRFTEEDRDFLEAVAGWVGEVAYRAELTQQLTAQAAEQGRRAAADELVTILAHDLRNLITPMRGRAELMRRRAQRGGDQRVAQDAESLLLTLNRLERLVSDLLDTARLDQGLFTLTTQPTDLVALATEAVQALGPSSAKWVVRAARDELCAEVDPTRLRQALENLLTNAAKHTPAGVPVRVDVGSEERDGQTWAVLRVTDQGPGIPPELVPRLFERFAKDPRSSGLGLGLYLAHRVATAHGGTLEVQSTPARGTCFTLALPVGPASQATDHSYPGP